MRQFLKYEFKRNYKSLIFSCLLILTSFIILSAFILFAKNISGEPQILLLIYLNLIFLVYISIIGAIVLFIINLIKSFYNNIFSDEGYLTLSFPKTTDQLLLSKIVANLIWIILLFCTFFVGIIVRILCGSGENDIFSEMYESIITTLNCNGGIIPLYLISSFIQIILFFVLLLLSFALINLGNLKKGKIMLGILIFMGISYVLSILNVFTDTISFGIAITDNQSLLFVFGSEYSDNFINSGAVSYVFNITKVILNISLIIGGYILTKYLLKNKIEIE